MRVIEPDGDSVLTLRCPACGLISTCPRQRVHVLQTDDREDMKALFAGVVDALPCPGCGTALPHRPVMIVSGFTRFWAADGSRASVAEVMDAGALPPGAEEFVTSVRNLDELRQGVTGVVIPWVRRASELTDPAGAGRALDAYWRGLTPEVFVGLELWLSGAFPGVSVALSVALDDGQDVAAVELLPVLGKLQAKVMLNLVAKVIAGEETLADDGLERYVAEGVVFPLTLDRFRADLAAVLAKDPPMPVQLAALAVHAALCRAADIDDPLAAAFAISYVRTRLEPQAALHGRLALSPTTAHRLLRRAALAEAVTEVLQEQPQRRDEIEAIAAQAGFPGLVASSSSPALDRDLRAWADAEGTTAVLDAIWSATHDSAALANVLQRLLAHVAPDDTIGLYEYALGLTDGGDEARAHLLFVLAQVLRAADRCAAFLRLAGDRARPWERSLEPELRASLWSERAAALRQMLRPREALAIYDEITAFATQLPADARVAVELNRAMVLRETGSPDTAAAMLEDLLERAPDEMRQPVVESLIATYLQLGMGRRALALLRETRAETRGAIIDAIIAALSADDDEVAAAIARLDRPEQLETRTLGIALSALAQLAASGSARFDRERFLNMRAELSARLDPRERKTYFESLQWLAEAAQLTGDPDAGELWERLVGEREHLAEASEIALLELARVRCASGRVAEARALLAAVPSAMEARYGGIADLATAVEAHDPTGRVLRKLATQMPAPEDLRLVAELQRDATGRARAIRRGAAAATLQHGLGGAVLARLAPDRGALHAIEWFDTVDELRALRTTISSDGDTTTTPLTPPGVELERAARRLRARLEGWTAARPGDPLDHPLWRELEHWLRDALADVVDGDHVLFFDHRRLAGLPWHAVAGPWTSSYASGWSAVLAYERRHERPSRLGVLSVPAADDDRSVAEAFGRSLATTLALGVEVTAVADERADAAALRALLAGNDIVKLMCHGFVEPGEHEVGLMLAADGRLPLQHAIAAASVAMAAHRFDWRDAQAVDNVARVVFSAACSSGVSHVVGLNERLGLFGAWRSGALIAPAWDGIAADVLPVIDATLERYLTRGDSLALCLRDACRQTEAWLPRWRAWVLCLEGDWR